MRHPGLAGLGQQPLPLFRNLWGCAGTAGDDRGVGEDTERGAILALQQLQRTPQGTAADGRTRPAPVGPPRLSGGSPFLVPDAAPQRPVRSKPPGVGGPNGGFSGGFLLGTPPRAPGEGDGAPGDSWRRDR